ncbi:uncharacterized protein PFL1_04886 [Pseudozyma flocculosa PF-1]|uniref:Uncharacterized protein n=1 Tax=Pseudozyma flocculosa PF-1 TaxID=1277687 RepID=A0A061H5L8_9BASI|nr:uncharacterized protein PFL1_04886 [Pseudozyma flocculosa PF-1]EPQ27749.1 hypothetical protein PFL1_04886 [Pseudozyma flocculosa PF-1]
MAWFSPLRQTSPPPKRSQVRTASSATTQSPLMATATSTSAAIATPCANCTTRPNTTAASSPSSSLGLWKSLVPSTGSSASTTPGSYSPSARWETTQRCLSATASPQICSARPSRRPKNSSWCRSSPRMHRPAFPGPPIPHPRPRLIRSLCPLCCDPRPCRDDVWRAIVGVTDNPGYPRRFHHHLHFEASGPTPPPRPARRQALLKRGLRSAAASTSGLFHRPTRRHAWPSR